MSDKKVYDNNNTGVLFKNDDGGQEKTIIKKNGEKVLIKECEYSGSAEIGGVHFYVDGYIRTPRKGGNKFMSLKFRPCVQKENEHVNKVYPITEDDIPF